MLYTMRFLQTLKIHELYTFILYYVLIYIYISRVSTLSMKPNLKMSTILFVLRYIRYKGRVKSQVLDSKVYSSLHCQVNR